MTQKIFFRNLFIFCAFSLTQFSATLYLPTLPKLSDYFHRNDTSVMLFLSIFFIGYAIGQLFWGTYSDYKGRRRTLLIALVCYCIIALLISRAASPDFFGIALSLLGFYAAAYTSIGNALLKDIYGKNTSQAIAYVGIVMAITPTIAPVIGAHLLIWFNWQAIFIFLLIYAAIILLGFLKFVPETHAAMTSAEKKPNPLPTIKLILKNRDYLAFTIVLGLTFGGLFAYFGAAPFIYMKYLGFSVRGYGWIMLATSFTYILGTLYNSYRIKNQAPKKIVSRGITVALAGGVLLWVTVYLDKYQFAAIVTGFSLFMLGAGIILPACKAGAMTVFKAHGGTTASIMKFIQTVGCILITVITAQLHVAKHITPVMILFTLLTALILVLFQLLKNKQTLGGK